MKKYLFFTLVFLSAFMIQNLFAQDYDEYYAFVRATEYDENNNVVNAVLIVEYEEEDDEGDVNVYKEEYNIEKDTIGKKLFEMDGCTIKFTGIFTEKEDGSAFVKVESFSIINTDEGEEEDEPDID